jgi:hypothetical protein
LELGFGKGEILEMEIFKVLTPELLCIGVIEDEYIGVLEPAP